MKYKIYTDGACSGNPGPGGWAAIIILDNKIKIGNGLEENIGMGPLINSKAIKKLKNQIQEK